MTRAERELAEKAAADLAARVHRTIFFDEADGHQVMQRNFTLYDPRKHTVASGNVAAPREMDHKGGAGQRQRVGA